MSHDGAIQRNDSRSTMDAAPQSLSVGVSASDSAESIAMTAAVSVDMSGLSDQSLFQRSNMKIVCELLNCSQRIFEKFRKAIETEPLNTAVTEKHICCATATYNRKVECAFHTFWSETLLREVPSNIFHYPSSDVISFDMRAMLGKLLQLAVDMDVDRQYCYDHKRKSEKSATQQQDKDMVILNFFNSYCMKLSASFCCSSSII